MNALCMDKGTELMIEEEITVLKISKLGADRHEKEVLYLRITVITEKSSNSI